MVTINNEVRQFRTMAKTLENSTCTVTTRDMVTINTEVRHLRTRAKTRENSYLYCYVLLEIW